MIRNPIQRLFRASVWHPDAVDTESFKYRNLTRVWLPLFDLISGGIGWLAFLYGSRLLNDMFPEWLVDIAGIAFLVASAVALVSVLFPRLYMAEIISKVAMLSLLGTYSFIVLKGFFFEGQVYSGFVALMLALPVIFPLARLQILGEEIKQRRVENEA